MTYYLLYYDDSPTGKDRQQRIRLKGFESASHALDHAIYLGLTCVFWIRPEFGPDVNFMSFHRYMKHQEIYL